MKNAFAIVGCGATAIAFLQRHLDRVAACNAPAGTIYLFEKREDFGRGAAYEADLQSNILNTKTGFITPYPHLPGHFQRWLEDHPGAWRHAFPEFRPTSESFAPRALFGVYLQDQIKKIVLRGASLGCQLVLMNAEVCAIDLIDGIETVRTRCGLSIATHKVLLFCGPLAKKIDPDRHNERVLATPYPVARLLKTISPDERVAVIGARLSAIDTVIALIEGGHRELIRMHSRSGYFPVVRGTQERVELKHLTREDVRALVAQNGPLQISDLVALFRKELAAHDPASTSAVIPLPAPPADVISFIESEINVSQAPRIWQAILYATNGFIEHLWQALDDTAQARFMSEYFSFFMAYRVAIPAENARKILGYLRSGQLEFVPGAFAAPEPVDVSGLSIRGAGWEHVYDRVIYATGFPRDANLIESTLLGSLIKNGTAICHPMGGICVDPDTYRIQGRTGSARQIYAVGELTVGQFFFTSALEINGRHAFCCADAMQWREETHRVERVEEHV
ncbi:FAD/NAD(P)-binding protein [Pseudomonas viridiflava]|uniref:FAD/NAD(P)-binding protein n=1 Tax=Pseudomonas viridiflava TaxID=33069 RepID=UPI001784EF04|nr:FAD/NAD(P)-binding protein [Pseudomonas viridiflava]MBD8202416.1 FAD/NAD(P)-binding protein [Pseudomonas viridiflava]